MPKVWLPNLLFEEELTTLRKPSAKARSAVASLAPVIGWLHDDQTGEPGFVCVSDDQLPDGLPRDFPHVQFVTPEALRGHASSRLEVHPWGWSSPAAALADELSAVNARPDAKAVQHVNSREFLAPFDVTDPPAATTGSSDSSAARFSELCGTASAVSHVLVGRFANPAAHWVIKAALSHAARNRLLGSGPELTSAQVAWIERQLALCGPVAVEPWVTRLAECGLQFEIPRDHGEPVRFLGAVPLLTDELGQYRGSLLVSSPRTSTGDAAWWLPAIDHGLRIAAAARDCGYFGPLGIDCMWWQSADGTRHVRPAHDVNARFTMGRVAHALRRLLEPDESGLWLHLRTDEVPKLEAMLRDICSSGFRVLHTSPQRVGGRSPRIVTVLVATECDALADQLARSLP